MTDQDLSAAARLVLGPRATRVPTEEPPPEEAESPPDDVPPDEADDEPEDEAAVGPLADVVIEAAESGIPAGLLDALALGAATRGPRRTGQSGVMSASTEGGRPSGTRAAPPGRGARLNIVDTLRAAAPWQRLRGRTLDGGTPGPVRVRAEDFRITRYRRPTETTVIFAVDASGSAALQRLAEAKGAVEQVLADCYVRRDHVALIAFRGQEASLLLPPTRSLARARKCLAGLAGGGTTPLASGIDAALRLAHDARRRGRTPLVVLMTDGRANVARDGEAGGTAPTEDALASARALAEADVPALFLDTAPRPRARAKALAEAMRARYLPLPYLDAAGVSQQVRSLAGAPGR